MIKFDRFSLLVLLLAAAQSLVAQTSWRRVASFQFDWDGHKNVRVVIETPNPAGSTGEFTRIRIRVPGQKEFILSSADGWTKYDSDGASVSPEIARAANVVLSKHVMALRAAENRTLLFLFGYSHASAPGSLDVLELTKALRPRVTLHRDEFGLSKLVDLDHDGIAEIVGYPCLTQQFGNGLLTYDPYNLYKLGATSEDLAKLSIPLSKTYNLKHYYGWAGPRCSEDLAVVLHPPKGGKPIVLPTKQAEALTGSR